MKSKITEYFELKTGGSSFADFDAVLAFWADCVANGIEQVEVVKIIKIEVVHDAF